MANCLNNLGVAYENLNDYQNELKYKEMALDMYKRLDIGVWKIEFSIKILNLFSIRLLNFTRIIQN